ncbi:MAG TPA: regulatory protein RecX [Moraxellaceae bacterium]|nr:regulatory protein RecX [Moraxellaceae bacterium]
MKRISAPESDPAGEGDLPSPGPTPDALRGRALALLTRREHSRVELERKLVELGGAATDVAAVLDELVERRLQSDERFAEVFVRSRAEKGYGPRAIAADLRARGLDAGQVEAALADSGYDWLRRALEVRQARFGRQLPLDPREKARQLRFLQYRGFSGGDCARALRCEELDPD